jgi:hypothetical protein
MGAAPNVHEAQAGAVMPVPTPLSRTPRQEAQEIGLRILQVVDDYEAWHTFWQAVDMAGEAYAHIHTPTELGEDSSDGKSR